MSEESVNYIQYWLKPIFHLFTLDSIFLRHVYRQVKRTYIYQDGTKRTTYHLEKHKIAL